VHSKQKRDTSHPGGVGLGALGVVFDDIGTSTICTLKTVLAPDHHCSVVTRKLDNLRGFSMTIPKHNGPADHGNAGAMEAASAHESHDTADVLVGDRNNEAMTVAATVGIVAVGAALFEVALLPGIALGVAAMLAPKYVPKMGAAFSPMFKSTVRGAYKFGQKTREMVAEAKEQVHDIVAEVNAEGDVAQAAPKPAAEAQKA
jgi:Protein of unknown function (DUF5132)